MDAHQVRSDILSWLDHLPQPFEGSAIPTAGERGLVIGLLNNALKPDGNIRRRQVLAWIFRERLNKPYASWLSTKDLSDEMWYALYKWTEAYKDKDTGQWRAHGGFDDEVYACWRAIEDWEISMESLVNGGSV